MLLSLLGTWLTSPLIPFEVAPQVCSHSISALSSCEARSNILYYHGKAAHTKWWSHNEKIQCPISTAKYLTSKLNWQMKLSAWWGAGKGLQSQGTEPQCLLLYSTLQFTEPCRCIWSLTFHAWRRHRHPHFTERELRLKRLVQTPLWPDSGQWWPLMHMPQWPSIHAGPLFSLLPHSQLKLSVFHWEMEIESMISVSH